MDEKNLFLLVEELDEETCKVRRFLTKEAALSYRSGAYASLASIDRLIRFGKTKLFKVSEEV